MTPKGHAIPSKTQLLSYGTPAFGVGHFFALLRAGGAPPGGPVREGKLIYK